jgi:hypothetical protein
MIKDRIRILKHEVVPLCGSFEVRFPDDRPPVYFYWDDIAGRRLLPERLFTRKQALEQATLALAPSKRSLSKPRRAICASRQWIRRPSMLALTSGDKP